MGRILITGGQGFIGSHLADRLAPDHQVTVFDNNSTGHNTIKNVNVIQGDINNLEHLEPISNTRFDYIFHYAAVVGVQRTLDDPLAVLRDIDGVKNVLELARLTGVKRVFYSSSSEVYGEPVELPQNEDTTPLNSRLPYAVVKNVGEVMFKAYQQMHGLDYTIFRFFNTYGPRQSTDFVMTKFIRAAVRDEPITIYGDGSQTRTFCCVYDNTETCVKVLNDSLTTNQTFNIGNSQEITIKQLAETITQVLGSASEIQYLPALKEGDMTRRCPDNSKMMKLLGRDLMPLENGIRMVRDYMAEYE